MQHPGPADSVQVEAIQAEGVRRLIVVTNDGEVTLSDSGGPQLTGTTTATPTNKPTVRQHGGWLMIRATRQEATVSLAIPAGIDVEVRTRSGAISTEVTLGSAVISTGSGDIHLTSVTGTLGVFTESGDLDIADLAGSGRLRTGSGDITLGTLHDSLEIRSGSGDVTVASNYGDLRVWAGSGDVTVGVPLNLPTWLDLTSATGDVSVHLPDRAFDEEPTEQASLTVATAAGDINVVPA